MSTQELGESSAEAGKWRKTVSNSGKFMKKKFQFFSPILGRFECRSDNKKTKIISSGTRERRRTSMAEGKVSKTLFSKRKFLAMFSSFF